MLTLQGSYQTQVLSVSPSTILASEQVRNKHLEVIFGSHLPLSLFHTCSPKAFKFLPILLSQYLLSCLFFTSSSPTLVYTWVVEASCLEILLFHIHLQTTARPILLRGSAMLLFDKLCWIKFKHFSLAFKTLWNLVSTLFSQTSATLYSHIVHFQLHILSFAIFFCAGLQCPGCMAEIPTIFWRHSCSIYLLQGVSPPPSVEGHNTSFSLHSYSAQRDAPLIHNKKTIYIHF